jgi:hypothetical protein
MLPTTITLISPPETEWLAGQLTELEEPIARRSELKSLSGKTGAS